MSNDYLPSPGVVAAYVVGFLHSLAIGTEVDTGTIAEAIASTIPAIISSTGSAVSAGLIVREKVGNRYLWRRGPTQVSDAFIAEHQPKVKVIIDPSLRATLESKEAARPPAPYSPPPAPAPREQSLTERLTQPRIVADEVDEHPVLVFRKGLLENPPPAHDMTEAAPAPIVATRKAKAPEPQLGLRAGLWSDGSLHIERGGRVETFSPDETKYLMRFFDHAFLRGREATVA